jgi:HD superfamily phosphohydrolase
MKNSIEASLIEGYKNPVRDVLWGHIYMTSELAELAQSGAFIRLSRIFQLGPVYLLYPGATHTRAGHSFGVYHLGRRLLQNLTEKGASQWLSGEGIKSFLAACLLHDLGHFPYTHSLKELPLRSHESLTVDIILSEPLKSLITKTGADPQFCAAIIDKEAGGGAEELRFYRKLLSGALDPDKLDYLNRDARYCGVPYGVQDVDFILSGLYPQKERGVDIDSRLIPNVEAILFSKYLMYRTVYWHRNVRSATAMIKKCLMDALDSGEIKAENLYGLDDYSLFLLLKEKTHSNLSNYVREGAIFTTAAEIPVKQVNLEKFKNLKIRGDQEKILIQKLRDTGIPLGSEDLIIDIPEPISFETGLYVTDEECYFNDSTSAFKSKTVESFIQSLYSVRVFINQKFKHSLKTLHKHYDIIYKYLG